MRLEEEESLSWNLGMIIDIYLCWGFWVCVMIFFVYFVFILMLEIREIFFEIS